MYRIIVNRHELNYKQENNCISVKLINSVSIFHKMTSQEIRTYDIICQQNNIKNIFIGAKNHLLPTFVSVCIASNGHEYTAILELLALFISPSTALLNTMPWTIEDCNTPLPWKKKSWLIRPVAGHDSLTAHHIKSQCNKNKSVEQGCPCPMFILLVPSLYT